MGDRDREGWVERDSEKDGWRERERDGWREEERMAVNSLQPRRDGNRLSLF